MVARGDDDGGFEQFAYDGQHMIGAYEQGIAKWEATYTSGQDQMIGFYDYVGGADLVPIRDWRNNVVSAFDMTTQTALGHAEYSPEGRITSNVNGAQPCVEEGTGAICALPGGMPFAFNGQWRSDKTGLTYMRNRWYSARLGQFVTTDPLHYVDSVNQYAFVGFDPINAWDPWGLGADNLSWNTPIPAQRDYWIAKQEFNQRRAEERAAQKSSTPKIDEQELAIGVFKAGIVAVAAMGCKNRHPACGLSALLLVDMENEDSIPNVLVPANESQAIGMLTIDLWIGVFALSRTAPAEALATLTKDKSITFNVEAAVKAGLVKPDSGTSKILGAVEKRFLLSQPSNQLEALQALSTGVKDVNMGLGFARETGERFVFQHGGGLETHLLADGTTTVFRGTNDVLVKIWEYVP